MRMYEASKTAQIAREKEHTISVSWDYAKQDGPSQAKQG